MEMYDLGLVIGRFQLLHDGHCELIDNALMLCKQVIVYIGSSQEYGTETNPFSYEVRRNMIEKVYPIEYKIGKIIVRDLPDMHIGNNSNWGKYILDRFKNEFQKHPDLYVTGVEKERPSWFAEKDAPNMCELRISRSVNKVTATECRRALLNGDYEFVREHTNFHLWKDLDFYKGILEGLKENGKIK